MSVRDIATLIRSEESRRWVEPFRDLYAIPTYGNTQLPHVNPMLPALCFGSILKKCRQNDYTSKQNFQPKIIHRNEVILLEINRLENESDVLHDEAISYLFEHEKDPIMVIKHKELYEIAESTTDYCEHVANLVESILVKNN